MAIAVGYARPKRGRPAKEPPALPVSRDLAMAFDAFDQEIANIDRLLSETRSEEHTSELQSLMRISYAVFCLKKKNTTHIYYTHKSHTKRACTHKYTNRPSNTRREPRS